MQTVTDFGKIDFKTSAKARRINIRILPNGLKVTLPVGSSTDKALSFISESADKIHAKQEKLKKLKKENPYLLTENRIINTHTFDVTFRNSSRNDIFFSLKDKILTIDFPEKVDHKSESSQQKCWKGIVYFLRKEANRILPQRTHQLANEHGFAYASVKIQSSRSRWGSCSRYKSINLSFYLMLLPAHLIDYVILHELCHTRQMNHSDKFWREMDKVTQNKSTALRTELKKYLMPEV